MMTRRHDHPTTDAAKADWTNLVDEHDILIEGRAHTALLGRFVELGVKEVLIEAQRKVGDQVLMGEVIPYLRVHVGRSNIRIANREFTVFAEVASNGVGRSWHTPQYAQSARSGTPHPDEP